MNRLLAGFADELVKLGALFSRRVTPIEKVDFSNTYSIVDSNNPQVHLKALADPKASQELLAELVFDKNPKVRRMALAHKNLHPKARTQYMAIGMKKKAWGQSPLQSMEYGTGEPVPKLLRFDRPEAWKQMSPEERLAYQRWAQEQNAKLGKKTEASRARLRAEGKPMPTLGPHSLTKAKG